MALILDGTNGVDKIAAGAIEFADLPTGSVLQIATGTTGTTTSSGTNTFVATNLTVSITPKFSSSKILIFTTGGIFDNGSSGIQLTATIYRNGTTNLGNASRGLSQMYASSGQIQTPISVGTYDSPATTSATTYTLYIKNTSGSGTVYFQPDSCVATLVAMEIAQ